MTRHDDATSPVRRCWCGSGLPSRWAHDARGIELGRVCDRCETQTLSRFRPEVLYDGAYEADEQIDAEISTEGDQW